MRTGLDDTMRTAFQAIRDTMNHYPRNYDYRTAAYVITIHKLAQSYYDPGIADTPVE